MMKKELLVKNLGRGSYRGAVSFMYGISAQNRGLRKLGFCSRTQPQPLTIQTTIYKHEK